MTAVESIRRAIVGIEGIRFDPIAEPWRPDEGVRDSLRVLTAHIGAHPPVVGATPHAGHWPIHDIGVGVTAFWDPDRCRPRRWQQHVCRETLHQAIDHRATFAPVFVLSRNQLWLVGGHHDLWLIIAARTQDLHSGPITSFVHLPGGQRLAPPSLQCDCPRRPPPNPPRHLDLR